MLLGGHRPVRAFSVPVWFLFLSTLFPDCGSSSVSVWDGVFAPAALNLVLAAGKSREHSFTSVFDRGPEGHAGRTIIEAALTSILDQVGDDSRYVEYWWRGVWNPMAVHRDVDEALCRTQRRGDAGVQRCPQNGHVLYLETATCGPVGPTCVFEEADSGGGQWGGPPRELQLLHVVPAKPGRLLRCCASQ